MAFLRGSLLFALLLATAAAPPARAQPAVDAPRGDAPTVEAVFFFSPTCPHCHRLMSGFLPTFQGRFGERLQLTFVDVSSPRGGALLTAVADQFGIPRARLGVPLVVAGDEVMIGEDEIPARLPALVERLLAAGGARLPMILGAAAAPRRPPVVEEARFPRLPASPAAIAILGTLLALLLGQLAHAGATWRRRPPAGGPARRWIALVLVLASLGVGLYLARAEISGSHVACLSDCDAVHASEWAWIFGLVPVGVFGVAGSLGLLAAWLAGLHRAPRLAGWGGAAFLFMALFGVAFSAWLTFLELFVIGALCEWCVANALLMAAVAALALAPGKRALDAALG
jgi:uncharacterized membrane protein